VRLPGLGFEWAMTNPAQLRRSWATRPACKEQTLEMAFGLTWPRRCSTCRWRPRASGSGPEANEDVADLFDRSTSSAPPTPTSFPAEVTISTRVGDQGVGPENNGAFIPANVVATRRLHPRRRIADCRSACVIGRHHCDALRSTSPWRSSDRPWPLVAPGAPI
jgi:hypothetical protein